MQKDLDLVEKSRILNYAMGDILKYYKTYRNLKCQIISTGDLDQLRDLKHELAQLEGQIKLVYGP